VLVTAAFTLVTGCKLRGKVTQKKFVAVCSSSVRVRRFLGHLLAFDCKNSIIERNMAKFGR
jgi:hypothetical protein